MIIVNCPYCQKEHMLNPDENERLIRGGKVVINCDYDILYTVEDDGESIFTCKQY